MSRGYNSVVESAWWNNLWKFPIPTKVVLFVWKLPHESILTFVPLWNRGVVVRPWCQVCRRKEESMSHTLFGSSRAKSIWSSIFGSKWCVRAKHSNYLDIWTEIGRVLSNDDWLLLVSLLGPLRGIEIKLFI